MQTPKTTPQQESSLNDILAPYLKRWYLFVIGLTIALIAAFFYLRYSTPSYLTRATIIIKNDKGSTPAEDLFAASGLGGVLSKYQGSKIENEIAIFKSRQIIKNSIEALELNVSYQSLGLIRDTEMYEFKPFQVRYLAFNDSLNNVPTLRISIKDSTRYTLQNLKTGITQDYNFGDPAQLDFGEITVVPNLENTDRFNFFKDKPIRVIYRDAEKMARTYQGKLNVVNEIATSNVVELSMQSPVPKKTEDFLDELIFQYNKDAIGDQNQVAQKTSDFIDQRLEIITRELDSVETGKEVYKNNNRLIDIESQAQLALENASEFEKRQFNVNTQLELANTMIDYMENSTSNDLLPANLGIQGADVSQSVSNYNNLILERNRLLKSSTSKNPVVVNLNNQISDIRQNILSSLQNTTESLKISLRDLNYQESILNSRLSRVPSQEKAYRGIERQQGIKEQLYLFLLQQREQASISLAVTASKAKVVDKAASTFGPVKPQKPLVYGTAALAGLLVPFLFLYVRFLLHTKIDSRKDIERALPQINILGEIPKLKRGEAQLIQQNDRSMLAESFRILRTNLQYTAQKNEEAQSNTIFVTSTIKGEGKTFVAFNLALTVALTGKKVALVGADIRNPQLHRYLSADLKEQKGVTEFIVDPSLTIGQIASQSSENKNLEIILSGAIPPNPAELLMEKRTAEFFEALKEQYDYIVVDTAPSMLVTDTILINQYADILLYVIRAGYTDKRLMEFVKDSMAEGRLKRVNAVLNNVEMSNFGYGSKYGYSYAQETKKRKWF